MDNDNGLEALFKAIHLEAAYHVFFAGTWDGKAKAWKYYPREKFTPWHAAMFPGA